MEKLHFGDVVEEGGCGGDGAMSFGAYEKGPRDLSSGFTIWGDKPQNPGVGFGRRKPTKTV